MRLATEVAETENLFEILANNSPTGLYIIQDGKFCYTNPSFQSTTGYKEDELLGKDALELVVPEDREGVRENAIKMLKGERTLPYQFRVTHKNGSIKWIIESVASVQYRGRRATLGDFIDTTAHKQAEEALQAEKNKLQSLVDAMEDGLTIQDRDYNIIYEGRLQRTIFGDHVGEKCYQAYEGNEKVCKGCPVEKAFKDGKSHTAERRTVTSGEVVFWENTANPIRDAKGEIVSCLEVTRNITERKQVEEKVQHLNLMLRAIRNINKLIARGTDRDGLLKGACDTFVKTRGYYSAWIALLDESGKLVTAAEAGLGKSFLQVMERLKRGKLMHCGCKVLEKPGILVMKDVSSECEDCLMAKKDTGRSAMSVRLEYGGKVYGLMTVSIPPGRAVGKEEHDMLEEITGDISFALHSMEQEQERKRVEKALRDSEEKLWKIFESATDGISVIDLKGIITEVNQRTVEMHGFSSKDELRGKNALELLAPRDHKKIAANMRKVIKQGAIRGVEYTLLRADGSEFPGELSTNVLKDASGNLAGHITIVRDITERKRAEEALRASEEMYKTVVEDAPIGIYYSNFNGTFLYGNKKAEEIVGYKMEELLGKSFIELKLLRPEGIAKAAKLLALNKLGKATGPDRFTLNRKDGTTGIVEIRTKVTIVGGKKAVLGMVEDITERKKQEQALADELTRRRLLVDQSLDGIVVLDVDAKVVEANQSFAEMLGYTLEEVHKLHTWDWDKIFPRKKILEMGRNVDKKGLHLETRHTRKDGSAIDVDISINAAMFGGQKLIFCVERDITERKKMEEALKLAAEEWRETFDSISDAISIHDRDYKILRANKAFADIFHKKPRQIIGGHCYELHSGEKPISGCPHKQTLATKEPAEVEFYESHLGKYLHESTSPIFDEKGEVVSTVHITRDITEQKQQNEQLMMADRLASIGELAAGTAHELNNPLTSVIGFSQLVMEKDIPDDIREDLKIIHNEAQRAAGVTKNLLTFARKQAPVKQLNQINNIIEDVLKLRAYEHKVNDIEVQRQLAPDLPEIKVDSFQMQQVFLNIIINAEYFMIEAHNKGTLTITTKKRNGSVRISIADDGPGIPPENLSQLFNPFFTTKETGKGTGLGLSICHGIVSEHGGQIYARSQPGKGATIVIELPINGH